MEAVLKPAPGRAAVPDSTDSSLRLTDVSKSWGPRIVLQRVTLAFQPGSLTLVAGANGAGKTTLLRIACGLLAPDHGSIRFDGLDPRQHRRAFQKRLGFLSAGDRGLYARLSVDDHLRLWARLALLPADEVDHAVERVSRIVELEELLSLRADRISMGQRQRLRMAMTFLHSPELVLLDEPLTSLDENGAAVLRRCIADVLDRSGVVVWCSTGTDRESARFDHQLWLQGGTLMELG